jgi:hypothetical protein
MYRRRNEMKSDELEKRVGEALAKKLLLGEREMYGSAEALPELLRQVLKEEGLFLAPNDIGKEIKEWK